VTLHASGFRHDQVRCQCLPNPWLGVDMNVLEWLKSSLADLFAVDPASLPERLEPSRSRREPLEPSPDKESYSDASRH
jgi:hypothetical protein